MAEVIGEGGVRVRFEFENLGTAPDSGPRELVALVEQLQDAGLCPVLDDGLIAGNAAMRAGARPDGIWVTPSGRAPQRALRPDDLVLVADFDPTTWTARGFANPGIVPSSDTPLHWCALMEAFGTPDRSGDRVGPEPRVSLHGHALDDEASANAFDIPISTAQTLFSTPEDREALLTLFARAPYPQNRLWSRRGHGFFLLADEYCEASAQLSALSQRVKEISRGV